MYYNDNTQIKLGETKMKIIKTALDDIKTKKISFNIEVSMLELIDDLAKLMKTSKTNVIMGALGSGMDPYMNSLKTTWNAIAGANPEKRPKADKLLKGLEKIENKYT